MPRRSLGARLEIKPAVKRRDGYTSKAVWIIRDGKDRESTGLTVDAYPRASDPILQAKLADYIARKHKPSREGSRHPAQILVSEVLAIYLEDCAPKVARPAEVAQRTEKLAAWWGDKTLADVNGPNCRAYAAHRGNKVVRRELEDLRAAINHHRKEGLCAEIVEVVLPERSPPRERWLTRQEAARLVWAAYRYREIQNWRGTDRRTRRHVARFILIALYTGTRAGAILAAALMPLAGHPWIDLQRGCSIAALRALGRRKNASLPSGSPIAFQRTCAAGNGWGCAIGSPSSGTAIRSKTFIEHSATPSMTLGSTPR
jgi:hypothetical protein